jgi:cystathionine beta-lyase
MMKYDFETIMDRHGKDAMAVDYPPNGECTRKGFSQIPMWVADMNFPTVPTIPQAVIARAEHPAYGYFVTPDAYYDAIIQWQSSRNHVEGLEKKHIGYENGVLGGVASALRVLCSPGSAVLVHSPTYIGFRHVLESYGYHTILSPLVQDEEGVWRMDYADMEAKIKENHIHAAIFCSPHNPCGRVWQKKELEKAMALFEKYQVEVISDEIWSDLILEGYHHIPTQSVSPWARDHVLAFYAPSKTFNLAGLIGSYHIVYDDALRDRLTREEELTHYNNLNVLSMHALLGAYSPEGQDWVNQLCAVLSQNTAYGWTFIQKHFTGVSCARPQGTYMLFLHCQEWCQAHAMDMDTLLKKGAEVGVMWQDGRPFHDPFGIRMNLALPFSLVQEAFQRLDTYVFNA